MVDRNTTIFSVLLLFLLSLVTVQVCRWVIKGRRANEGSILFEGTTATHAFASNVGALFSLTYFFGGGVAYGYMFGYSYIWTSLCTLVILMALMPLLLQRLHSVTGEKYDPSKTNILIEFFAAQLGDENILRVLLRLYCVIYFLLLVVELAVARLVLSTMISVHPAIVALMLATLVLVVIAYLHAGGFKAVLVSDTVQLAVAAAFVLSLVSLMVQSWRATSALPAAPALPSKIALPSWGFGILLGFSWFLGGVDFFSRLNFQHPDEASRKVAQRNLILVSLVATFSLLLMGVAFGIHARTFLHSIESPWQFTYATMSHFLASEQSYVPMLFLASVFCMIFTTIDTLFLTLLQLGHYTKDRLLSRQRLPRLALLTALVSAFMPFEMVSVTAIFAGSLFLIPVCALVFLVLRPVGAAEVNSLYFQVSLLLSLFLFWLTSRVLALQFEYHFLVPGMVLLSVALARLGALLRAGFLSQGRPTTSSFDPSGEA